jgi:hypothetical protein
MYILFEFQVYLILIMVLIATLVSPSPAIAQTYSTFTVNTSIDTHDAAPGNGICADAIGNCSFRAAIEETNALVGFNTISLPTNTYTLAYGQLQIADDLTIDGANESTTIVSGQDASRVILVDKPGGHNQIQVHINDITIANGNVSGNGGGVLNDEILIISNCTIRNNNASNNGGGIYNADGGLSLIDSVVISNTVTDASYLGGGGGIYNTNGDVILINTDVMSNTGASAYVFGGGGILNFSGRMTLIRSSVRNNIVTTDEIGSSADGGGIFSWYGNLSLMDSTVNGNSASSSDFMVESAGGGIYIFAGEASLDNSIISDNSTSIGGGGIYNVHGNLIISNSTINNNTSARGGGIDNSGTDASVVIKNSSIVSNTVTGQGGGLYHFYGDVSLIGSTFSNNSAGYQGDGLFVFDDALLTAINSTISGNSLYLDGNIEISHSTISDTIHGGIQGEYGSVYLKNTILAANCSNIITSLGHNLISDSANCDLTPTTGDIVGQDPKLTPLAQFGGNTNTHALSSDSPAIDTGICTDIHDILVSTDQRGASRDGACDIGAYEYGGTITVLSSFPNPSLVGETVIITATVVEGEPENPTGNVVFYDSTKMLGSSALDSSAQAVLELYDLSIGTHLITATYQGDPFFALSTSEVLTQTIYTQTLLPIIVR